MLHLFALIDYGIVVTMGICGLIPVRLSIFCLDLVTSLSLFKLPMEKWYRSLCPVPIAWLRCNIVGWIVGSIQFGLSVLRMFPSGVVIRLDYSSWLSMQVRIYFAVTALVVSVAFCSNVLPTSIVLFVICSILLLLFCSIILLAIILLFSLFLSKGILRYYWQSSWGSSSIPFFSYMVLYYYNLNSNVCNDIEMCSTLLWIRCTPFWFLVTTINIIS